MRSGSALDRQGERVKSVRLFYDIQPNQNGMREKRPGAKRLSWPETAPYVTCHDPKHFWDMIGFTMRLVRLPTPIAEPGGAIILDPEFDRYPEVLREVCGFEVVPSLVRQHCLAKIRHGLVRGGALLKEAVLEVHAGADECGVSKALGWTLEELIASQLRGADNLRQEVPNISRCFLTFHYQWSSGERNTVLVNERLWRRELGL